MDWTEWVWRPSSCPTPTPPPTHWKDTRLVWKWFGAPFLLKSAGRPFVSAAIEDLCLETFWFPFVKNRVAGSQAHGWGSVPCLLLNLWLSLQKFQPCGLSPTVDHKPGAPLSQNIFFLFPTPGDFLSPFQTKLFVWSMSVLCMYVCANIYSCWHKFIKLCCACPCHWNRGKSVLCCFTWEPVT